MMGPFSTLLFVEGFLIPTTSLWQVSVARLNMGSECSTVDIC